MADYDDTATQVMDDVCAAFALPPPLLGAPRSTYEPMFRSPWHDMYRHDIGHLLTDDEKVYAGLAMIDETPERQSEIWLDHLVRRMMAR